MTSMHFKLHPLKEWFLETKRDLPWRQDPSPYRVWISEVMLQQTQVAVVISYFERWMRRFPTIESLAQSSLDEVLKMWEGLGYYSRARSLHEGAKTIISKYNGELPKTAQDLETIKGLGPYTIGAILSFAYRQKSVAVDGNVMRVLSRLFLFEEDISKIASRRTIENLARELIDEEKEHWIVNESLIELGATVCTKAPKCHLCPLQSQCLAYSQGKEHDLPKKTKKTTYENLYRAVAVICHKDNLLVTRGKKGEIMRDLYEFPFFETDEFGMEDVELKECFETKWKLSIFSTRSLSQVEHSFTKYRVKLFPHIFEIKKKVDVNDYEWRSVKELQKLPFSSGHLRIFKQIAKG